MPGLVRNCDDSYAVIEDYVVEKVWKFIERESMNSAATFFAKAGKLQQDCRRALEIIEESLFG